MRKWIGPLTVLAVIAWFSYQAVQVISQAPGELGEMIFDCPDVWRPAPGEKPCVGEINAPRDFARVERFVVRASQSQPFPADTSRQTRDPSDSDRVRYDPYTYIDVYLEYVDRLGRPQETRKTFCSVNETGERNSTPYVGEVILRFEGSEAGRARVPFAY